MTPDRQRIAVLAHAGVLNRSGYARRVLDCAASLRRALPTTSVAVLTLETPRSLRRREAREEVQRLLAAAGIALEIVHAWPRRWGFSRASDWAAASALARLVARGGIGVVHAHGPAAIRLAVRARADGPTNVVADVHGDQAAEGCLDRGEPDPADTAPDAAEAALIASADGVVYASGPLAARFPAKAGVLTAVVPCLVADERIPSDIDAEARRAEGRKRMGLAGEEWVVAYAGSFASWQETPRLAKIFAHLVPLVPQLRVLVLTPDRAAAAACFHAAGLPKDRAILREVAPDAVVDALLVADAGVILRRPALANTLAFPTKFAEYLAAGLEVVVSDAVPSIAEPVARTPALGHVLGWPEVDERWAARIAGAAHPKAPAARAARRAYARQHLVASTADSLYRALYATL